MCPAEVTSNSEKIKPVALPIIELHLSEGISQSVSQSVGRSVSQSVTQSVTKKFCLTFFKNHSNLLKAFWVNLKVCLNLFLPNQYC